MIHYTIHITSTRAHADVEETPEQAPDPYARRLTPLRLHRPAIVFDDAEHAVRFAAGRADCTIIDHREPSSNP